VQTLIPVSIRKQTVKNRLRLFVKCIFVLSIGWRQKIGRNKQIYQHEKLEVMYALKNKVQLIGNLGGNPEVKNTENGKKLAKFTVATNENYRNAKGDRVTETQWHNVVAWGKVADIVEKYLLKGSEVALEGKIVYRNYTDKDGNKKYYTEIQVNELLMLTKSSLS
jgi:single-strand DNA-binding protein